MKPWKGLVKMDDWRENFRTFSNTEEDIKTAFAGLILFAPVFVLVYVIVAVLAAL